MASPDEVGDHKGISEIQATLLAVNLRFLKTSKRNENCFEKLADSKIGGKVTEKYYPKKTKIGLRN